MLMASKLVKMVTYHKGPYMTLWSRGPNGSRDEEKPLYLH